MVLCICFLAMTYGTGQAGFYVIPVVRDSAPTATPCANDGYEVLSDTGKCWMAFNLGATRVAISIDDEAAYGDLYQWGRRADGHERRNLDPATEVTNVQSETDNTGHGYFIGPGEILFMDWRSPQNDFFWQGVRGINNPCPQGFRLPTRGEWEAEILQYGRTEDDLFNSPLKLVPAGYRHINGEIKQLPLPTVIRAGHYWSSSVSESSTASADMLLYALEETGLFMQDINERARLFGASVRCIKD